MKTLFIVVLIGFSTFSYSQVKDAFTGQIRKESPRWVAIKSGFSGVLQARFRCVDTSCFVVFNGTIGVGIVTPIDRMIFLFADSSTVSIYPSSIQSYEISRAGNYYYHQYIVPREAMEQIANKELIAVRRYTDKGYYDINVDQKRKSNLMKEARTFL